MLIMLFTLNGEAATTTTIELYTATATSVGGITTTEQFAGSGAWQNNPGVGKLERYLPLTALGTFSINYIAGLNFSSKKVLPAGSNLDFCWSIYTNPHTGGFASWHGQRITSEPM